MLYLTPGDNHYVCDIEADSLHPSEIFCLAASPATRDGVSLYVGPSEIRRFFQDNPDGVFVFHNGIRYDAKHLNRLLQTSLGVRNVIDTFVLSQLYNPSNPGGHSLANLARGVGLTKSEFNDFSRYTEEMGEYCKQDVLCGKAIYLDFVRRFTSLKWPEESVRLEHQAWALIEKQRDNGFFIDVPRANQLLATIRQEENDRRTKIHATYLPERKFIRHFAKSTKANGERTSTYLRHCKEYPEVRLSDDGGYDVFDDVPFNIGSPIQRVERLVASGWKPRELTPTGQPKPIIRGKIAPSLSEFMEKHEVPGVQSIAEWMELNARGNMLENWIDCVADDSCIHGDLYLNNTLRYRHSRPNTANIPGTRHDPDGPRLGVDGMFTYEARSVWTHRGGADRCLVGVDAKGIQLRILAHYLNNKEFIDAVVNGDPHERNREIGGFGTRDQAKTFIYAFVLGAGDKKVGEIIGGSVRDGRDVKKRFIERTPGLKQLLDRLSRSVERTSRIRLCDGTPILVHTQHAPLAYLLQGDENRLMKKAMVYANQEIRKRGLDVLKVGDIHDEWQNDVLRIHAEEFANDVCPIAFAAAGKSFLYRVPIACDYKIGETWAETH